MISNGVIIQSSQLSRVGVNQQLLNEGSSVLVRVISDTGNGKYTGSVAGVRVSLTSNKPLAVGSSFVASISTKNGVIYVSPKSSDIQISKNIQVNAADNSQLSAFLQSLGLSSDELYLNILQEMKQLEMKLDVQLMNKIHNLSLRFKGKEKKASELLMLLAQKGKTVTESELLDLINYLADYEDKSENQNNENKNGQKLLNDINKTDAGWFLLPFELYNLRDDIVLGKGCIRMLFDKGDRLKLLNLYCKYNNKDYLFSLLFENKFCKTVKFNISSVKIDNIEKAVEKLQKKFFTLDNPPKVLWCEPNEIEGSACESEEIFAIGGEV